MNLRRLELTNGSVYEVGAKWPDETTQSNRVVGPIFYRPETSDPVALDDDTNGVEGTPAHYEVWCVADEYFQPFIGVLFNVEPEVSKKMLAEAISKEEHSKITVVRVPHTNVFREFEDMPAMRGLEQISDRFKEIHAAEEEEKQQQDNGQPQQTQTVG